MGGVASRRLRFGEDRWRRIRCVAEVGHFPHQIGQELSEFLPAFRGQRYAAKRAPRHHRDGEGFGPGYPEDLRCLPAMGTEPGLRGGASGSASGCRSAPSTARAA
ncbi:MAG: hypothetical protein MZV65_48615 [Chromatiales bacterium]|nr:hypothetical protein [Chromatiales bacterium]